MEMSEAQSQTQHDLAPARAQESTVVAQSPSFAEGSLLAERYLILRRLNDGFISEHYLARDIAAVHRDDARQTQVVVKVLKSDLANLPNSDAEIFEEALVTRYVSHSNILRVFDYHRMPVQEGTKLFLTEAYAEGETLEAMLARQSEEDSLPWPKLSSLMMGLAQALDCAHDNGIVHADVQPKNIIFDRHGVPKLMNFGIARGVRTVLARQLVDQGGLSDALDKFFDASLPHYGSSKGYVGRALMEDLPVSKRDDLYGFACLLYEMLGGLKAGKAAQMWAEETGAPEDGDGSTGPGFSGLNSKLTRPAGINFIQWRLLRSLIERRGLKQFSSVQEFFKAFQSARVLPRRFLVGVATIGVLLGLSISGYHQFVSYSDRLETMTHSDQLLVSADQLTTLILKAPFNQISGHLKAVEQLPPLLKSGVLANVESEVVYRANQWLDVQVQRLVSEEDSSQNADAKEGLFQEAQQLIDHLGRLYPNNLQVFALHHRAESLKKHIQSPSAIQKLKEALNSTSAASAEEVTVGGASKLSQPKVSISLAPISALEDSSSGSQRPKFDFSEIADKATQPGLAVPGSFDSELSTFEAQVKNLWVDKALMTAYGQLFDLIESQGLQPTDPQVRPALVALSERFDLKIKYYQQNDPYVSTARLETRHRALMEYLR